MTLSLADRMCPRRILSVPVLAAVLLAAVAAGCDVQVGDKGVSIGVVTGRATEQWTRSYSLPSGGRLDIINVNGRIQVDPSSTSRVEVVAMRTARAGSDDAARTLLAREKMIEEVAPDHVRVEARREVSLGFGNSLSVDYEVRIPPGLNASFHTQNGAVQLSNVRGTITAESTNGAISGEGLAGPVSAKTVNGGIQLSFADVKGDVDTHTVNGGIRIEVPPDANAQLNASVVNGRVSVDDTLKVTGGAQDRTRVSGMLNKGGPQIVAETTNGGVRIYSSGREISELHGR